MKINMLWDAYWKYENCQKVMTVISNMTDPDELFKLIWELDELRLKAEDQYDYYNPRHNDAIFNLKWLRNRAATRVSIITSS